jgi:hypothetical protein
MILMMFFDGCEFILIMIIEWKDLKDHKDMDFKISLKLKIMSLKDYWLKGFKHHSYEKSLNLSSNYPDSLSPWD